MITEAHDGRERKPYGKYRFTQVSGASDKYDTALAKRATTTARPIAMPMDVYTPTCQTRDKPESDKNDTHRETTETVRFSNHVYDRVFTAHAAIIPAPHGRRKT